MPIKNLKAVDILEDLESKLAYIPGGRDHDGRSLIIISVPPEFDSTTKSKLESLILYFISIFSEETKENGLVLVVDARHSAWRVTRSCIKLSTNLIEFKIPVIVIRPDGFWDKRVDSCTKSHKEGQPIYVTLTKLHVYIDLVQLPYELAGNKAYNHVEWIKKRMKMEDYSKDALQLVAKMTNLHKKLNALDIRMMQSNDVESYWEMGIDVLSTARRTLESGRSLVSCMSKESSKDILDTIKEIHKLLDSIQLKQIDIENSWTEMERNLDTARLIKDLEHGVSSVTDWILGPADTMLNSCCQVGFDVSSSEELRRQHEKIELQCRETYGRYAQLLHKIDSLPKNKLPEDLKSQRDFMDFVCRSFASRLERRRNVLITSQRFFRLVSEYFDRTSQVFEQLVMGNRNYNLSQASIKLLTLEKNQTVLDSLERELVKEGEKLSDILSMPVKDALGREVCVNYDEDIVNVKDILDATNARKNIFNDSVELQKLSLKQIALIYVYEKDVEQAVEWLNDLFNVLLRNHMQVGCNVKEIQSQKEKHQSFQETAKRTYEYGGQLVNGARVVRLSCRISLKDNACLSSKLRQAWRQFRSVSQEQLTRLRVCAVFHRNIEHHCTGLQNLAETVLTLYHSAKDEDVTIETQVKESIRDILDNREKLLLEVGRMVRLGRLLKTRLKEPLYHQSMSEAEDAAILGGNLTAVEAISAKLAQVTRLAEKLDARLCEAGARTRPRSIPTVVTSSASSLLSISATLPLSASVHTASNTTTVTQSDSMTASTVSVIPHIHPIISEPVLRTTGIKSNQLLENSRSESATGEYNVEGYTTATECSTTPPLRSRSESFVTLPDCEDLSTVPVMTCTSGSTWLAMEKPKPTDTIAPLISTPNNENENVVEATSNISTLSDVNRQPTTQMETMDKITNEKSNRIVKQVTETTVLRVSHDIRLDVASYTVISNTMQDHRQHIDVKDIQSVERMQNEAESHEKTDDIHPLDLSPFKESKNYIGKSSKKVQPDRNIATKLTKIRQHNMLNENMCSNLREYASNEDAPLSSQDLLQHEDSGIKISMKKDDNLEGEDFLERARKL